MDKSAFADWFKFGRRYRITINTRKGVVYYQPMEFIYHDTGRVLETGVLAPCNDFLQPVFLAFKERHDIVMRGCDFRSGDVTVLSYTTKANGLRVEQGVVPTGTVSIVVVRMTETWIIVRDARDDRSLKDFVREPSSHRVFEVVNEVVAKHGLIIVSCRFQVNRAPLELNEDSDLLMSALDAPNWRRLFVRGGSASDLDSLLATARIQEDGHKRQLKSLEQEEGVLTTHAFTD